MCIIDAKTRDSTSPHANSDQKICATVSTKFRIRNFGPIFTETEITQKLL